MPARCGFLSARVLELGVIEVGVEAALGEELVVAALLHDVAVLHHQDEVCVADGGQAVSYAHLDVYKRQVVDPVTVKPFDEEIIWKEAQGKKLVVTYENHSVINGIGLSLIHI